MPDVKLEIIGQGPYIVAPDFCPYREIVTEAHASDTTYVIEGSYSKIHPSICAICTYCTFIPESTGFRRDDLPIQDFERGVFIKYLTEFNSKIANNILLQHKYLLSKRRTPIAIFISPPLLSQILEYCGMQEPRKLAIQDIVFYKEQPLCAIVGCPVYVSRKLSRVPVQVVGEITWK